MRRSRRRSGNPRSLRAIVLSSANDRNALGTYGGVIGCDTPVLVVANRTGKTVACAALNEGRGRALRYGIGVGREGFQWQGLLNISRKAEWPDWTPPPEMIARQPYLPRFMAGGPGNPLGARAMYLGTTVYRIHGTNRPDTIGTAVSSGCFRLVNADVTDLYNRVPVGTKVIVRQKPEL